MPLIETARFLVWGLKARFRDQKCEFDVIRRHVRPGDIVCDIGANKGSFVLWLSRWCRGGRVIAFEPQPDFAARLAAVCRTLRLDNVTVEAKAVHARSGAQDLFVPSGHSPGASLTRKAVEASSFTTLSVPVVALDDYFAGSDRIALLKIDVEGAELGVLQGAERILRRHAPLLVLECENRHLAPGDVGEVFGWLEALGYRGCFICRDKLLPLSEFVADVHQRRHGEWFWKSRDYCNNFVFVKR